MKLTRLFGAIAAASVIGLSAAFAGGSFTNWPVVGGASYCVLFAGDGTTCAGSEPAGPTIITGNERVPADTTLPNGNQPQTVRVPLYALGVGPYQYTAPLTGASVTVLTPTRHLVIEPAGTIAALTVVFPAATVLSDNQTLGLCSTQIVTALTITPGSGTTVSNTVTALAVPLTTGGSSCPEWVYRQANTTWYRVH